MCVRVTTPVDPWITEFRNVDTVTGQELIINSNTPKTLNGSKFGNSGGRIDFRGRHTTEDVGVLANWGTGTTSRAQSDELSYLVDEFSGPAYELIYSNPWLGKHDVEVFVTYTVPSSTGDVEYTHSFIVPGCSGDDTDTPTPVVTTVTPVPQELSCTDSCTINPNTDSDLCGVDTEYGQLRCLNSSTFQDCDSLTGAGCQCAPISCASDPESCQNLVGNAGPKFFCEKPDGNKVQELSCNYNSLAFVEVCTSPNPDGTCNEVANSDNGRLMAQTVDPSLLEVKSAQSDAIYTWGAANDKQLKNKLRTQTFECKGDENCITTPTTAFISRINQLTNLRKVFSNINIANGINRGFLFENETAQNSNRLDMAYIYVNSSQKVEADNVNELLNDRSVKIASDAELQRAITGALTKPWIGLHPSLRLQDVLGNEQYTNGDTSQVTITYDTDKYAIAKNGSKIYTCVNELTGENTCASTLYQKDFDAHNGPNQLDTIGGLPVQCGTNVVYGWTLLPCNRNFDFIFVVDVSSSMHYEIENGKTKLDETQAQLSAMIETLKKAKYDHRAALVTFNSANGLIEPTNPNYTLNTNAQLQPLTVNDNGEGILKNLTDDFDAVNADIATLNSRTTRSDGSHEQGTCILCGMRLADYILDQRTDTSRTPVVILLSDGMENAYENTTPSTPWGPSITDGAAQSLVDKYDTTVIAIAYGNGKNNNNSSDKLEGWNEFIKDLASSEDWYFAPPVNELNTAFNKIRTDLIPAYCKDKGIELFGVPVTQLDVNDDGIVNTVDLFIVYENYFAIGDAVEDVNKDGSVNIHDVTLIISALGTVVDDTGTQ